MLVKWVQKTSLLSTSLFGSNGQKSGPIDAKENVPVIPRNRRQADEIRQWNADLALGGAKCHEHFCHLFLFGHHDFLTVPD